MKGILIIILVLSLVLVYYTGGVQVKDGKLSIDFQITGEKVSSAYYYVRGELSKASQGIAGNLSKPPPDYELQITEVRFLKDCVQMTVDKKDACLFVKLEIRNNHTERIDFEMLGKAIVTKDGKQLERYGGLYNTKGLNGICDTDSYYKIFPAARAVTGMCYPLVSKSDEPALYIKMAANGKRKEHNFDLTPYIS